MCGTTGIKISIWKFIIPKRKHDRNRYEGKFDVKYSILKYILYTNIQSGIYRVSGIRIYPHRKQKTIVRLDTVEQIEGDSGAFMIDILGWIVRVHSLRIIYLSFSLGGILILCLLNSPLPARDHLDLAISAGNSN